MKARATKRSGWLPFALLFAATLGWSGHATADATPDPFVIPYRADAHPGALVYSVPIAVHGIDEPTPIEITSSDALDAGYARFCRPPFTDQPGIISDGEWFCVRHRAGYGVNSTAIKVGSYQASDTTFRSYAIVNRVPAPGGFQLVYNAPVNNYVIVGPQIVTGFSAGVGPQELRIGVDVVEYQLDCAGPWLTSDSTIRDRQTVCVRLATATTPDSLTSGTLFLGDGRWNVAAYTGAAFTATPNAFSFAPAHNVRPGSRVRGKRLEAVWGLGAQAGPISVTGGFYSSARQSTTTATGMVYEPDFVVVEHDAPIAFGATTTTMLTIGTVSASFTSTTLPRKALTSGALQDFNGDGNADIVWRDPLNGDTFAWLLDSHLREGYPMLRQALLLGARPDWTATHAGDFDGDGTSDIVWRKATTGETALWRLSDGLFADGAIVMADLNWRVTHVGDFDGDGTSDLVWHNGATGQTAMWLMNGLQYHAWGFLMQDRNWRVEQVGDFDGDGKADLVWRGAASTALWLMDGVSMRDGAVVQQNGDWRVELVGDIDGDGRDDLVWSGPDGQVALYLMDGIVRRNGARLPPGRGTPVALGDMNGDGKDDLFVESSYGTDFYYLDGLTVLASGNLLQPMHKLGRIADYDGDGFADTLFLDLRGPLASLDYMTGRGPYPAHVNFYVPSFWTLLKPAAAACQGDACLSGDYRTN